MHRFAGLFFSYWLITGYSYSQGSHKQPDYLTRYAYAEKMFAATNATAATDSIALAAYRTTISFLNREKIFNEILVDSWLKCGFLEMSKNNNEGALDDFNQASRIVEKNPQLPDSLLFKPYMYAGSIQYNLNNLDSAIYFYKKAEQVKSRNPGLSESERLFNKFGALYYETGDYNTSISYFEKALSLVEEKTPYNTFFIINYQNNIATARMKLGQYDQALKIFRELLKYGHPGDELLYNIGNTYFEEKKDTEALKYIRQIRDFDFEKFTSLTKIFIRQKQYDSAQYYLSRAKALYISHKGFTSKITYGTILKYSGDLKAAIGKPRDALVDYQLSIISLDPAFTDKSITANPANFSGLQNFSFLFDALVSKAVTLESLDHTEPGSHWLEQSISAYRSALALAKYIERSYFSDDARLFLKTRVNPATQSAVNLAIRLFFKTRQTNYINEAFGFVENNKATVLQAGLKNLELSAIPGVPQDLLASEKKYRTILAKLNIQAAGTSDSALMERLQIKIHDIEISLKTVQDRLDENKEYHDLKYAGSLADMRNLQANIGTQDEIILSYYYTDTSLICFYITKEETGLSVMPLHANMFSAIFSLRKELQNPEGSGRKYLQDVGSALFQELIQPVFEKIKNKKRLVVIPFNEIGYVPFEMMVNPADGSLLLEHFAISYNYSANFFTDLKQDTSVPYRVLAMAPFSGAGSAALSMPLLTSSENEIAGLPGKKLYGAEATKNQFVSLSGLYPVVHLATHAVASDSNILESFIAFYGLKNEADTLQRLYEPEIYALDLKTVRLVILSACETGNGRLVNGEGVMSLSRAFSYAGCKSVITSLWKADEESTAFITGRLQHYLQKGLPADEALQKAKLDYLASASIDDRYKNPAYWAHLVLIGDTRPVVDKKVRWYIWLAIIGAAGLLVISGRKKINQA
jgi:CHAT domain-containing protein/tetratricopeptide (TPR) repeat protein